MTVTKRSYSLDPDAVQYLEQRAKESRRSASSLLSDLILEIAQRDAARKRAVLTSIAGSVPVGLSEVLQIVERIGGA